MKSFKIPCNASLFVSKQNCSTTFNNFHYIAVGQYESDEFRGLLEFNLNPRIFDFKIRRADLVIYLTDSKIDLNIEALMLNIARNFDKFDHNNVTWETAPRFFQEAHFSKIESNYCKNSIIIDVTKILNYWIKNRVSVFGLTLLGLTQSSLVYISNTGQQKPFLEIFLDDVDTYKPVNRNYCNSSNNYSNKVPVKEDYHNLTHINSLHEDKNLAYGTFISNNGELLASNYCAYIKFDFESNTNRTNLNISNDGIFILSKGLYKVDYFINCRSEPFSTVELELDGLTIPFSQIQIASCDAPTSSSTIINVTEDNMILKLKLSTINSILINTGICASLTLVKIN